MKTSPNIRSRESIYTLLAQMELLAKQARGCGQQIYNILEGGSKISAVVDDRFYGMLDAMLSGETNAKEVYKALEQECYFDEAGLPKENAITYYFACGVYGEEGKEEFCLVKPGDKNSPPYAWTTKEEINSLARMCAHHADLYSFSDTRVSPKDGPAKGMLTNVFDEHFKGDYPRVIGLTGGDISKEVDRAISTYREKVMQMLENRKGDFGLDGVELSDEDVNAVIMQAQREDLTLSQSISHVLEGISNTLEVETERQ